MHDMSDIFYIFAVAMKKTILLVICGIYALVTQAQTMDTTAYNLNLEEVVVTGTRRAENVRFLPMTVSIISRQKLTQQHQTNVLPTVMQQVPGVFVTSRSMMGYGVSTGAAGGINMRGITGGAGQLMVLIDGHPQYQGIYGHPISDSYQTMMAERVEVLRGPASVLFQQARRGRLLCGTANEEAWPRRCSTQGSYTGACISFLSHRHRCRRI